MEESICVSILLVYCTEYRRLRSFRVKVFEQRADEELGHAKKVAFRLMQLGETPTDDPAQWEQDSGMGKLQPSRFLSLRSALERALEFERAVIGLYNDLANWSKGK